MALGGGLWVAAATCAAVGVAALTTRTPPYHHARHGPPVSGHAESAAARAVGWRRPLLAGDSYSVSIPLSRLRPGITDQEILARFTRGFFGGPAFTPERWLFALSGYQLTDVEGIREAARCSSRKLEDGLAVTRVGAPSSIADETTPVVGSLLFGNFLVLDSHWAPPPPAEDAAAATSYIDFVYGGGERSVISGSHRFQVSRRGRRPSDAEEPAAGRDEDAVDIAFSSVTDLAGMDGMLGRRFLGFHRLYSHLLFSDGIRRTLQAKA
ncbi:hypothetical protein CT0861_08115 [Colletotrichum tofieldiae]|uniref:Uncharacterized protein n=1 Tax=Colletotrichum tofieldiae TaxID=708197 RepID=A0A166T262_9PEZI|nr:hypothetical protein CT0861_08115 [Colletotrichum tofieldiae]GKT96398.1 hypothetical protein Ct61P_14248 [Colletotrichum tofieldiae]